MSEARAVWFAGPRLAELRDEPPDEGGPHGVRIRTLVSGISHGTEMLAYRGEIPSGTTLDLPTFGGDFSYPLKHGYASVGRVVEVGARVQTLSPDDLVFALHPHQTEYVLSDEWHVAWRLGDIPPERAVFVANLETALNVLLDAPVRIGERVVVFGQGIVGLLIGLLARRNGAGRVVVVDPYERRRAAALSLGADAALAPSPTLAHGIMSALSQQGLGQSGVQCAAHSLRPDSEPEPADATGGRADVVFEASGNPAALQAALDCVADEGTVVVCSWYGSKPATLELGGRFHRGRLRLQGTQVGRINPGLAPRWDYARRMAVVMQLLAELPLERLISHRIPFGDAACAFELVDRRPDETLQVVLTYE